MARASAGVTCSGAGSEVRGGLEAAACGHRVVHREEELAAQEVQVGPRRVSEQ